MPSIIHIEVDLPDVKLPRRGAGMVLSQPYLELTSDEPYRCTAQSKTRHLQSIEATLQVARARSHEAPKTHFTVFPEYSIPVPDGVEIIEQSLQSSDWPSQTFVIAGIDGISKMEYAELARGPNTHIQEDPSSVPGTQWINCAIIWVKRNDGRVERWLQPKLSPSWLEQDVSDSNMFRGGSVFVFKGRLDTGTSYRFGVLICFDWIANVDGKKPWMAVVESMAERIAEVQEECSLSWLFVIQHNSYPSHTSFMEEVNRFFDHSIAESVRRDRSCLVFANSAGRKDPGRIERYGHTSLIFSQGTLFKTPTCHPTFCTPGDRFRGHRIISHHKDLLFREGGACIHSFEQVSPDSVVAGAAGRTIALRYPFVYPDGGSSDPRTPANAVAASVKWINDELDTIDSVGGRYREAALSNDVANVHERIKEQLRKATGLTVDRAVALASATLVGRSERIERALTADDWQPEERDAVIHMVDTFSILGVCARRLSMESTSGHVTICSDGYEIDVFAIRGEKHEMCREHLLHKLPFGRRRVLLVSRDVDNIEWPHRFGSYLDRGEGLSGVDWKYTNPQGITWQLGYKDLLDIFRSSESSEQARTRLHETLRRGSNGG